MFWLGVSDLCGLVAFTVTDLSQHLLFSQGEAGESMVIASALDFPVIWWYSTPAIRSRLHYIEDPVRV